MKDTQILIKSVPWLQMNTKNLLFFSFTLNIHINTFTHWYSFIYQPITVSGGTYLSTGWINVKSKDASSTNAWSTNRVRDLRQAIDMMGRYRIKNLPGVPLDLHLQECPVAPITMDDKSEKRQMQPLKQRRYFPPIKPHIGVGPQRFGATNSDYTMGGGQNNFSVGPQKSQTCLRSWAKNFWVRLSN